MRTRACGASQTLLTSTAAYQCFNGEASAGHAVIMYTHRHVQQTCGVLLTTCADRYVARVQAPGFLPTLVQRGVLKLLDLMKVHFETQNRCLCCAERNSALPLLTRHLPIAWVSLLVVQFAV